MYSKIKDIFSKGLVGERILFLCSVFSTMPIIAINIGTKSISFFTCFFIAFFLYGIWSLRKKAYINCNKEFKIFLLWLIMAMYSGVFGLLYYYGRDTWFQSSLSYLVKTFIYIIFILLISTMSIQVTCILEGLLLGSVLNILWAGIDTIYYSLQKNTLTNVLFATYIQNNKVRNGSITIYEGNMIRPAGFNLDPASIGLFAPFVFGYGLVKKNALYTIIGLLGCFFSGSTTSIICCVGVCLITLIQKSHKIKIAFTLKKIILLMLLMIVMGSLIIYLFPVIKTRVQSIADRIGNAYVESKSENLRLTYIKELPKAISNQGVKLITGTGFNSAADGYLKGNLSEGTLLNSITDHAPYDMENLYLAYFFDCGLLGFCVYIMFLIRQYKSLSKMIRVRKYDSDILLFSALLAILFSSLFYHYTLYSFHMLVFVAYCKSNSDEQIDCFIVFSDIIDSI